MQATQAMQVTGFYAVRIDPIDSILRNRSLARLPPRCSPCALETGLGLETGWTPSSFLCIDRHSTEERFLIPLLCF